MDLVSSVKHKIQPDLIVPSGSIGIAISGGIDSMVLLDILRENYPGQIHAIHINHHLQPSNQLMRDCCIHYCKQHAIKLSVIDVTVEDGNVEQQARLARYGALKNIDESVILMAHHFDDLLETLTIRLLQGRYYALPYSLPYTREIGSFKLIRPMIDSNRASIKEYAINKSIVWVEDPSNDNTKILRNRIRYYNNASLINLQMKLNRYAKITKEFERIATAKLLPKIGIQFQFPLGLQSTNKEYLLRLWILKMTKIQISPSFALTILKHHTSAATDKLPISQLEQWKIRRYQGELHVVCDRDIHITKKDIKCPRNTSILFKDDPKLENIVSRHFIKRIMQKSKVPPWLRGILPFFVCDNQLWAIWGIYIHPNASEFFAIWDAPPPSLRNVRLPLLNSKQFQYNGASK